MATRNAAKTKRHQDAENIDTKCGLSVYPKAIQFLATPRWALIAFGTASFLQGAMCNGMVNIVLQAIERQFQISSAKSGLIASAFNLGSFTFLLPVTFLSGTRHRPRFMAVGCFLMGCGAILFAMPHFLAPRYRIVAENTTDLCPYVKPQTAPRPVHTKYNFPYWYILLMAQFINGAATTPFYTSTIAYIDDNMQHHIASRYIAYYFSLTIVGPACGAIVAGYYMNFFTEPDEDISKLKVTPRSPVWVGLWWKQFIYVGIAAMIASVPIACVPRMMPGSVMIGGGMSVIGAKLFMLYFYMSSADAAKLMGLIGIFAASIGTLMGGIVVSFFRLTPLQTAKLCILLTSASWFCMFGFLMYCDSLHYVGVSPDGRINNVVTSSNCGENCTCNPDLFHPVCSHDGVMFTSACAAGCIIEDDIGYRNCLCILRKPNTTDTPEAVGTICATEQNKCHMLVWFSLMYLLCLFIAFFLATPSISVTVRVVHRKHKSFCMGIQWMIIRLLGTIPAGVLFGYMLDRGCFAWQTKVDESGTTCAIYNSFKVSRYITGLLVTIKTLSVIFYCCATYYIKNHADNDQKIVPSKISSSNSQEHQSSKEVETASHHSAET